MQLGNMLLKIKNIKEQKSRTAKSLFVLEKIPLMTSMTSKARNHYILPYIKERVWNITNCV